MTKPSASGIPPEIARILRERGPVIDVPGTKALYEPLLARQPREGVRCLKDVAYGRDSRHCLDVYLPEAAGAGPRPAMVFIHGGGFIRGDKSERANVAYEFAAEGYVVVLPNYRLGPAHHWPAGAQDVTSVLEWVAAHASELGVDPQRMLLVGESAGAAHAAASTLLRQLRPSQAAAPAGVALISGPHNARLEALARKQFGIATPDPRNEAYFGADLSAWDRMSTVDLVDADPFPLLITYAELDPPQMQVQSGELFARLVSRHGFRPALQVIRGHNHLSQLYSIGTGDDTLAGVLRAWMARVLEGQDPSVIA
jgi:triacylglycerol lipase